MTKELVGPIRTMRMRDGSRLTVEVPQNTLDPRYMLCTRHHVGCDCYEAERNENANEYRLMWNDARDAAEEVLAGHRTFSESYKPEGDNWSRLQWTSRGLVLDGAVIDEEALCMCTGCQIARKAYLR